MNAFEQAISERAAFEASKSAENTNMQRTLETLAKSVAHERIAELLTASNVDAQFINRAERSNARYNVYAAEKVVNVARTLAKVASLNHYTLAVLRTAIALEASDSHLTHKDAVCACSASVKHTSKERESLISKTRFAKHVSANTASTQSSSSINALQTCNVLQESRDAANIVTYSLCDNDVTRQLREIVAQ